MLLLCLLWVTSASALPDQCQQFHWATDVDGTEKAAILLPVNINGTNSLLQLDTGADINVLYGNVLFGDSLYGEGATRTTPEKGVELPVKVGSFLLGQQVFHSRADVSPGQAAGILGLPGLLNQVFTLDYRNRLLCFREPLTIDEDNYFFIPARLQSGKLFLFSGIDSDYHWHYFLDTGASLYDLVIDEEEWQLLSGKSGHEADNSVLKGTSWGQPITTVGTRINGVLALGSLHLEQPRIHFIREKSSLFANYPVLARGLIGNAPFLQQKVLLDLRPGNIRFGIDKQVLGATRSQLSYGNR